MDTLKNCTSETGGFSDVCNRTNATSTGGSPFDPHPVFLQPPVLFGIIGGIAGGLFLYAIVYWFVFLCVSACYLRRKYRTSSSIDPADSYSPNDGGSVHCNSDTFYTPTYGYGRIKKKTYTPAEITSVKRLTYIGAQELERGNLVLLEKLGDGTYGPVYRAEAWNLPVGEKSRLVTAKLVQVGADEKERGMFHEEISVTSTLNHPNVVGLLGVCTKEEPECLVLDAGQCIDLLQHIRTFIASAIEAPMDQRRPTPIGRPEVNAQWFKNPLAMITEDELELLTYADQVCLGMAFLAETQFVHKDLSARNCIVTPDGVVKVANFGISRQLYPEAYCDIGELKSIPLRWMSAEAVANGKFTTESDVWSFGVLLWEVFMYGEFPYSDLTNTQVYSAIATERLKLQKPEGCSAGVLKVMDMCWEDVPASRPAFLDLHERLYEEIVELQQNQTTATANAQ